MKKIIILIAVAGLIASSAFAEGGLKPAIYVGGGIGMPMTPTIFSDYWKMGVGFDGGVGFQFSPKAELVARISYNSFPLDADKLMEEAGVTGVTIDGLDFQSIEMGADIKILMGAEEAKAKPYVIAGGGFSTIKFTDATVTGDDGSSVSLPAGAISETDLFFGGGVGMDYMISPTMGIWFDGRVSVVLTEGESTIYLPIRGGLKFAFGGN